MNVTVKDRWLEKCLQLQTENEELHRTIAAMMAEAVRAEELKRELLATKDAQIAAMDRMLLLKGVKP